MNPYNGFWTKEIKDPEEREEFLQHIRHARPVLERVNDYIESKKGNESLPKSDYDSPSWAFKQADYNGYMRAMKEIQQFLNLKT